MQHNQHYLLWLYVQGFGSYGFRRLVLRRPDNSRIRLRLDMTWGEFEAASPAQRKARARQWIAQWQQNYALALQMDAQADADAHARGIIDESPIDRMGSHATSSTNRNPNT
jgi:hypothetical protein